MRKAKNLKNITIEYYNVCSLVDVKNRENTVKTDKYEISPLLKKFQSKDPKDRTINYCGENLILSTINYNENSKLWELVFSKSRSSTIPFVTDSNGVPRQLVLKKGEMLSEVLCALYNPESKVLAMQRNIYAFGTKGLEEFFSAFMKKPLYLLSIQSLSEDKKSLFKKSKIKKFRLRVKNPIVKKNDKEISNKINIFGKNTTICKVIDAAVSVDSSIINIEFSMGNSSQVINVQEEDFEVFEDLMNNNNVKCLELGLAPDEHSTMQITDFMDLEFMTSFLFPLLENNLLIFMKY